MFKYNFNFLKSKRILLPGLDLSILSSVSSVLSPYHFLFSTFSLILLSQLVFSLKGFLSQNDIQKIPSVQFYLKFISSNYYLNSLCTFYSISQTLGFDFEVFLVLQIFERLFFLFNLEKIVLNYKGPSRIFFELSLIKDPLALISYRKALSLKCRTVFLLSPLYSPSSLVVNINLLDVDLYFLEESSKLIWVFIGLDLEEFNFLFFKNLIFSSSFFDFSKVYILFIQLQLKKLIFFGKFVEFSNENIVLKTKDNLTLLERQVMCFYRPFPFVFNNFFFIENSRFDFKDNVLKASYYQKVLSSKKKFKFFF